MYDTQLTKNKKIDTILKWMATVLLIVGTAINSLGYYPEGPLVLLTGGVFWLIVSIRWRESSLIVTNGVLTAVATVGLLIHYLG
jgi:hypothetical protein